jgi:hypothetical protein
MELVQSHWQVGGRRTSWMTVYGRFREWGGTLQPEERVRFALELANMMINDGMPDHAFETLKARQHDVESGEVTPEQRYKFWELRSRCLQAMGPYADTKHALDRAIASSPDEATRLTLEAELAEISFLQGDETGPPGRPQKKND